MKTYLYKASNLKPTITFQPEIHSYMHSAHLFYSRTGVVGFPVGNFIGLLTIPTASTVALTLCFIYADKQINYKIFSEVSLPACLPVCYGSNKERNVHLEMRNL